MSPPAEDTWKEVRVFIQDFSESLEEVPRAVEDRKDRVCELALQWICRPFEDCSGKEATMKVHDSGFATQLKREFSNDKLWVGCGLTMAT